MLSEDCFRPLLLKATGTVIMLLETSDIFTLKALAVLVGAYFVYGLALAIYRLYLSPLSKFPGPKLAAATFWYEFYYDVWLGGKYIFHINQLHQKYGPVIRINPLEIHVQTPEFYDVLYSGPGHRRHKWYYATRGFGADTSTFATVAHDAHRMRKAALSQFFSMGQVRQLEPVIQKVVDAFMRRVDGFRADGQVLRIDTACSALTADITMQYAIGKPSRLVEVPDFDLAFQESLLDSGRQLFLSRQFPVLLRLVRKAPSSLMLKLNPTLTSFYNLQMSIGAQVARILNGSPDEQRHPAAHRTIFVELLDSKLPPDEKTFVRLAEEGGVLIGAGTLTTAWALTVAVYYLLREPECLVRLKQELAAALPGADRSATTANRPPTKEALLPILERLPYLNAVIQESLRRSYGVASRLTRLAPDEELVVPGGDGREWRIPPNTPVSMTQLDMLLDEGIFPLARRFRPERWIENPKLARFQVAFGKGSRRCLGMNLALAEIYLVLAALFGRYGSREVRMNGDVGYLELFETDDSDIECSVDGFLPLPKKDTKGVRIRAHPW
ncbi:cytochrome P450 [Parathielavia appendiculata]|uniref:Cytochrome P450 n=1 Tax=Parathielavia appendiculata TaxID=2587402 RepID=A0AAN6TPJ1_9PEZI|nr:cytochrome P450 [Parathielavia appendiculata]